MKSIYYQLTKLEPFRVQPILLKQVEALLSLVGINFPVNRFRDVGKRCGSRAPYDLDTPHLFKAMGNWLTDVIEIFEKANVVRHGMWQRVSQECCDFVRQEAGVLVVPSNTPDLYKLLKLLKELEQEDQEFQNKIWVVGKAVPNTPTGGQVNCTNSSYQPFFKKFPATAPRTQRSYYHFERVLKVEPCYTLLQQCKNQVPGWVRDFLEKEML